MSRTSPSRQSSFSYVNTPSRRSSISSNPNIFSDDYALEPIDPALELSLQDTEQYDFTLADQPPIRDTLNITPYPAIPPRLSALNRPNSISKQSSASAETPLNNHTILQRAPSTASGISTFRSPSPYSGPTQPSHPYAMYPQITRVSSFASDSTLRPPENPFMSTRGPEHPYAMYQQNTVPEDDGDDIGTQPIPLGFQRLAIGDDRAPGVSRDDVGDIVGTDGHVEQLPPYTRFAYNVIAKGDMRDITDTSTLAASRRASQRSTMAPSIAPTERMEVREPEESEREILLDEEKLKESWKDKAKKKVCGGIALWLLLVIVLAVVLTGVLGGVIGVVVGRYQGAEGAATATVFMDADPAYTNKDTPACPTGKYTIPLRQAQEINACVVNGFYGKSWGCLDIAFLGMTISETYKYGNKTLQVSFTDYSDDSSQFLYGPQPPDFNGSTYDLKPYHDKDNKQLGVAMFFYQEFDKLSILPGWMFKTNGKREVDEHEVRARGAQYDGDKLMPNDQPWFCFWNSTINEFFIYLQQPITTTATWSVSPTATPMPTLSGSVQQAGYAKTVSNSSSTMWTNMLASPTPTISKRDAYLTPYYPQYPQLVKMIEKRKPYGNLQPYCQKMTVMPDMSIVPRTDVPIIMIKESQYAYNPVYVGRKRDTTTHNLESNCVCSWMST